MSDNINKKKAEAYDLMIQQMQLNNQLQSITQLLNTKIQEIEKLKQND